MDEQYTPIISEEERAARLRPAGGNSRNSAAGG